MNRARTSEKISITDDIVSQMHRPNKVHTLIVSDVHLGSRVSRSTDLLRLLRSYQVHKHAYQFDRLILLGDIFDGPDFKHLNKDAWELIGLLRQIAYEQSNAEVIWLLGNHDIQWSELMEHMVGITVYREYTWDIAGKRFLAMHGDVFDKWITKYPALAAIPCWLYNVLQDIDGHQQRVSRYVKEKSKVWLRINDEVARGMIRYARGKKKKVDAVFCGHTHIAEASHYADDDIWYYNTGCWTGNHAPTYALISHSGVVTINELAIEVPAGIPSYQM